MIIWIVIRFVKEREISEKNIESSSPLSHLPTLRNKPEGIIDEYDFCVVLPAENGKLTTLSAEYVREFKKLGFDLYGFIGARSDNEIFVLIKASIDKLRVTAEKLEFRMLLDPKELQKVIEEGNPGKNIAPRVVPHRPDIIPFEPYDLIFGRYTRDVPESLYKIDPFLKHPFNVNL